MISLHIIYTIQSLLLKPHSSWSILISHLEKSKVLINPRRSSRELKVTKSKSTLTLLYRTKFVLLVIENNRAFHLFNMISPHITYIKRDFQFKLAVILDYLYTLRLYIFFSIHNIIYVNFFFI